MIHNARNEVRDEEGCDAINPCCGGVAGSWGDSRGAAANENPRIGYLSVSSLSAMADRIEARLGYKLPVRDKNVFTSPEEDFDEYKDCDGCSNSTAVCWMCVSTAASGGSDLLGAFEKL